MATTKTDSNFLPEDYVEQREERRLIFIGLALFLIIMASVAAAFFVTNRQWASVRVEQQRINTEFADAARKIEELTALEQQKKQLDEKAEITAALVERVPRSILLAEFINRMPDAVSLEDFELKSERVRPRNAKPATPKEKIKSLSDKMSGRQATKEEEAGERQINVPKYRVHVELIGVAPTDVHVSEYMGNLKACPLLTEVDLKYSKETMVNDSTLRQFRIRALVRGDADANSFEPLRETRLSRDPMDSQVEIDRFNRDLTGVTLENDGEE